MTSNITAKTFLQSAEEFDKEKFKNSFDNIDPNIQETIIDALEEHPNDKFIEFLPYIKYKAFYDKIIKSDLLRYPKLISGLSKFHFKDAGELLGLVFQETDNEGICQAAADGLAKSKHGLSTLEAALQSNDSSKQLIAAVGISNNANKSSQPELIELIQKYRTHENYRVRLECLIGLFRVKQLSSDYLRDALEDENDNIRYRVVHLIRDVDESIAKDFIRLLEDPKGYIVSDILEIFEKGKSQRLDEEALTGAIISELIVRESGRPPEYFNTEIVSRALQALFTWNSRLYGQTLKTLSDNAFNNKGAIRRRAALVAIDIDERGFLAQINENAENDPESAKEILNLITGNLDTDIIANQISGTDPSDIQQNAANQIKLLAQYHESGLQQAKTSFNWAIVLSLAGFPFLILAIYYLLTSQSNNITSITSAIASVLVEFVAGTLFYLYNQTRKQLTYYHQQMNQIQRFLLANSVAESLEQPAKETARMELIKTIANSDIHQNSDSI